MSLDADITTTSATSRLPAASATVRGTGARISGRSATKAETPESPVTSATTMPGSAIAAGKSRWKRLEFIQHQPLTISLLPTGARTGATAERDWSVPGEALRRGAVEPDGPHRREQVDWRKAACEVSTRCAPRM